MYRDALGKSSLLKSKCKVAMDALGGGHVTTTTFLKVLEIGCFPNQQMAKYVFEQEETLKNAPMMANWLGDGANAPCS